MTGSWRGLAVAAAIAVALSVLAIADLARTPAPPASRALVPGFDEARVTELIWERAGRPVIHAVRAGSRWELRGPAAVPADGGAIGEVLAALRGGRWHRQGEPRPVHATLTVAMGSERHAIGIAEPIAGTEQSWIVGDGRGLLVDGWLARALDRDPLSLRIRRPLADIDGARSIALAGNLTGALAGTPGADPSGGADVDLQLEGVPRRLVRPSAVLLAPQIARELERALRDVAIVRLPDGPLPARGLAIRVAGGLAPPADLTLELGGGCPGAPELIALSGTAGDGCVEPEAAAAVGRAVAQLLQPPGAIVDRRPIPFEPRQLVLADGTPLDTSPPRVGGAAADPARVAELLAALAAPAGVVGLPAAPPIGHIVVRDRAADRAGLAITLDLFADRVLARHGEPIALAPPPGAWSALVRPSRELRDLGLWREEPTTITALVIDDVRYQRGAVIGAWSRRPGGAPMAASDAARVEALAGQLASPRALGFTGDRAAALHRVTIEVTPPVGAAIRHALELGAPNAAGCPARAGGEAVLLPAAVCAEAAALSRPDAGRP